LDRARREFVLVHLVPKKMRGVTCGIQRSSRNICLNGTRLTHRATAKHLGVTWSLMHCSCISVWSCITIYVWCIAVATISRLCSLKFDALQLPLLTLFWRSSKRQNFEMLLRHNKLQCWQLQVSLPARKQRTCWNDADKRLFARCAYHTSGYLEQSVQQRVYKKSITRLWFLFETVWRNSSFSGKMSKETHWY